MMEELSKKNTDLGFFEKVINCTQFFHILVIGNTPTYDISMGWERVLHVERCGITSYTGEKPLRYHKCTILL